MRTRWRAVPPHEAARLLAGTRKPRPSAVDMVTARGAAAGPCSSHSDGSWCMAAMAQEGYSANSISAQVSLPHAETSNLRRETRRRGEAAQVGRLMNEQIDALNWMNSRPILRRVFRPVHGKPGCSRFAISVLAL